MKILIVEDDANILSFLKNGFTELGYMIDSATDGFISLFKRYSCFWDIFEYLCAFVCMAGIYNLFL